MDLKESKFYYAGHDMNFAVFSDYPCRVKYVDSIRLPIDLAPVEIYTIEPASNGQWVVVEQWNEGESSLKSEKGKYFARTSRTIYLCI